MKSEVRSRTQGVGSRKHCRGRGGRYPLGAAIPQQEALGTVRMGVPLHRLHHLLIEVKASVKARGVPLYRCVVSVSVKELCRGLFVVVPL